MFDVGACLGGGSLIWRGLIGIIIEHVGVAEVDCLFIGLDAQQVRTGADNRGSGWRFVVRK